MTLLPEVLYQGSVKDVRGVRGEAPYVFEFSDRYSIFDWGVMPDNLNHKGAALAFMAWFFFNCLGKPDTWKDWQVPSGFGRTPVTAKLRETGVAHHALDLVSHDLRPMSYDREILSPTRCLTVKPVQVIHPGSHQEKGKLVWDYAAYKEQPENALVPLEIIFRFGVPEGSSLLKRTGNASYRQSIGLEEAPKVGDTFTIPVIEFSTKLETTDRYISYKEAQDMAGLSEGEFDTLKDLAALVALRLKDCFKDIGVELWDGKLEFAFGKKNAKGERDFMLVDSIGPDELRLIRDSVHLSKELLRGAYRDSAWFNAIEQAKKTAEERGEKDWKRICIEEMKYTPSLLSPAVKQKAEMVYMGLASALSEKAFGKPVFPKAWSLDEVVKSFAPKTKEGVA